MKNKAPYICYTDGSCKKSEGTPGGWGVYIKCPDGSIIEKFAGAIDTTTSEMELTAIREALSLLPEGVTAQVMSDSQSALDYCVKRRNAQCEDSDLLQAIDALLREKRLAIEWKWIRGHNGNAGNERADELAAQGAREAKAELKRLEQVAEEQAEEQDG